MERGEAGALPEAWLQGPGIQSVPPYFSLGPILAAGVLAAGWARDRFPMGRSGPENYNSQQGLLLRACCIFNKQVPGLVESLGVKVAVSLGVGSFCFRCREHL